MQILAQALDGSGAVVGQRLEWVPGVLPPGGSLYFTVDALPPADAYRVSVWHWEFLQAPGGGRRLRTFKDGNEAWRFFPAVQAEGESPDFAQPARGTTALRVRRGADETLKPG